MYSKTLVGCCLAALAAFAGPALAQTDPGAKASPGEKLGKVNFPTSCSAAVQAQFERGVAMLHSYWFTEGGKVFTAVAGQDPGCAMAYWGLAANLLGNSLAFPPPAKDLKAGAEAIEKARAIGARTERERDWIEALGAYYRDSDQAAVDKRLLAYALAMEQVVARYPDDYEAKVFYALGLQATAPKSDLSYSNQLRSAAILEQLYLENPQHPGVSHFLIHAYDFPPLAEKGLAAARRYAGIAPAAPHARHMPSHIYSMVGSWEESIVSNAAALEVQPDYHHARDFMVYAHLQLGQDAKARALMDAGPAVPTDKVGALGLNTALAAMPARYVLERADWKGAASLPILSVKLPTADPALATRFPIANSIGHFARGLGMARSGDLTSAKSEVEAMRSIRAALEKANNAYWAARSEDQILAVSAWVALGEGAGDQALKLMRAAADLEDGAIKHVAMENRLFPLRELFGDMLLEMKRPAEAFREYETAIKANPRRARGLHGAAMAAEQAGDRTKSLEYYRQLVELTKNADTLRPEIVAAREWLAKNGTPRQAAR